MRKLLLLAAILVAIAACTNSGKVENQAGNQLQDTTALIQRVMDIYGVAFSQYNDSDSHDTAEPRLDVDSMFCSQDWNAWVKRVNKFDNESADGMMGFFEADYWIMGQDWDSLSVSDVHVKTMTDSTATVELNLHNCGSVTAVRLEMVLEGDQWRIDDFIDVTNDVDWKAGMKEYMNNKP